MTEKFRVTVRRDNETDENGNPSERIFLGVYNRNAAEVGNKSAKCDLTAENLISSGKLIVNVSDGENTKFIVKGTAKLGGTTFIAN